MRFVPKRQQGGERNRHHGMQVPIQEMRHVRTVFARAT